MKKAKYVEATEKTKKYPSVYVGIELQRTSETVSILGVGKPDYDDIDIFDLDLEDYNFKVIDRERVLHSFTVATKKQKMDAIDAEIKLMGARRNLKFCEAKLKENFGITAEIADMTT